VPVPVSRDRSEYCTAVLTEYDDDGFIGVQIDAGGQTPGMQPFELHHPFGFASRCRDRETSGRGCTLRFCYEGDEGHAWLAVDPRCVDVIPSLAKGASVQYSYVGTFGMMDADEEDGTYTLYVPVEFTAGVASKAHLFQIGLDSNGKRVIHIVHSDGYLISIDQDDGVQIRTSDTETFFAMKPGEITMQAQKIMLKGNVYAGAQAEAGVPLASMVMPGATPPCPTLYLSPV
jgi:hypothetical protein